MYPLNEKSLKMITDSIGKELEASHKYLYLSECCMNEGYLHASDFFAAESIDERKHARIWIDYATGRKSEVEIPGIDKPEREEETLLGFLQYALDMEVELAKYYSAIAVKFLDEADILSFNKCLEFISIQERSVSDMQNKVDILSKMEEKEQMEADMWIFNNPENSPVEIKG